ncbi:aldo/keto reductase [Kineococcus aurantiacus]|uniref:Putative dehydrogenase/aryl-alcohol dehydrogenase-like putative oxidoreductase n=1 Tax=Kineococcus aurantiacus TaxID=37633 RepID=A0A7Y9J2G5_9ACTN|nr:aldo/keto reductase [Kineococcus aurantiacus]NYD24186.1 putative dehydrogenase/aryl-alcohol dehydrogenase-like putative oxidoreductase [Kineococcus aurantiacus]
MPTPTRWAVLGPGGIAHRFASQLPHADAELVAVGSSPTPAGTERARAFAAEFAPDAFVGDYDAVLARDDVDAVYVSTVHVTHAKLALAALRAGKHVLVEKPFAPNHGTVMAMVDAARRSGVHVLEAYMYAHHPQFQKTLDLVRSGAIGTVQHVDASFSFATGKKEGRLYDADLAGGGILDVGGYPVSAAHLVAGAALGHPAAVERFSAQGTVGETGVDEWAVASLTFAGGITASARTGVGLAEPQSVTVYGSAGTVHLPDPWTILGDPRVVLTRPGAEPETFAFDPELPANKAYALEAKALVSDATPAFTLDDTLAVNALLNRWRDAIGLRYPFETDTADIPTVSGLPLRRTEPTAMRYGRIPGLDREVSRLVMGCDNQPDLAHASAVFDAFVEAGGNTFDTAWVYGMGKYERLLGRWIANRGIRADVNVIVKGCHTPHCDPESLTRQLFESFERQGNDHADIYMMHRDNEDIPVGEFVDVLDEHASAGRITVYGGSNWSTARVDEANEYAAKNGKRPFSVLSNHFGLAEAYDVPWAGCRHVTDPGSKKWLSERNIALLPWSSQARGFFARADADDTSDAELVRCYYSEANFERKARAEQLGRELGVPATAIALAFVLAQPFEVFALFGPRTIAEARSSMTGLGVELTEQQVAWLDLREG